MSGRRARPGAYKQLAAALCLLTAVCILGFTAIVLIAGHGA